MVGGCPAHLRMFSIIPNLYTLDAGSHNTHPPPPPPPGVTTKTSPDTAECSLAGKSLPQARLRVTALKEASLSTLLCLTYRE